MKLPLDSVPALPHGPTSVGEFALVTTPSTEPPALPQTVYESLAGFRYEIRRFFAFSKQAIEGAGLPPVQYQAMLAIKAHPGAEAMSISALAEELFIRIQSAVELVDRLEEGGLVRRSRSMIDRRRITLSLTPRAEAVLATLAGLHLDELKTQVPEFIAILSRITAQQVAADPA